MAALTSRGRSKPHALAVPSPFQGHMHPLMELSKRLVSAGFMVTFANTEANHRKITTQRKHPEKKAAAGPGESEEEEGELRLVSVQDGLSAHYVNGLDLVANVFKPEFQAAVARLCKREPPVSLLVFDFRLPFMLDIARDSGLPSLALWTQSAGSFACNLLGAQGYQLPPDDSTLITCLQGVPPFKRSEISNEAIDKIPPPFPSKRYGREPFERIHEPTWIVMNTFKELEVATMDALHASLGFQPLALGPLANAPSFSVIEGIEENDNKQSHLEWLGSLPQESVLYIAFGTNIHLSEEQLEELVLGLEASQQSIFWAFRSNLCKSSKNYTIESLSRRFKKQGVIVSWASQWDILSHPSVGGFLTHCGWNSTMEGIAAGVPMLAWPAFVDQYLTRRCLEEQWGIGMGFENDEIIGNLISRFEIQDKVKELMQGKKGIEMRRKAKHLSGLAKSALDKGGSSHQDFALFMQGLENWGSKE